MERVRDRLGTELSWEGERFEARVRYRLDRALLGGALSATALSCVAIGVGVLVDARALATGGLLCVCAHLCAHAWAIARAAPAHLRHLDRTLVAHDGRLRIDERAIDATTLDVVATHDRGPTRVLVLEDEGPTVVATLAPRDAKRVADALGRALNRAPRTATAAELLAWRTPTRGTGILALAGVLGFLILAGLYAAILTIGIDDPATGRVLGMIAGPLVLLSPVPYWALVRRVALP